VSENQAIEPIIVTIDGPSGSGKGTLSQMLARHLGFQLLDSGALYRLTALAAMKQGVDLENESQVSGVAESLDVVFDVTGELPKTFLAGEDVTDGIRREEVGMNASVVAAYPLVREALLARQRAFAAMPGLIADGRDMGTTVFPSAQVKIFLTASPEARAERRFKQLQEKGQQVDMALLVKDICERDERDMNRSLSPLRPAETAMMIDSTQLTIKEVFLRILAAVEQI
jgi:CMP/dCMP kinase